LRWDTRRRFLARHRRTRPLGAQRAVTRGHRFTRDRGGNCRARSPRPGGVPPGGLRQFPSPTATALLGCRTLLTIVSRWAQPVPVTSWLLACARRSGARLYSASVPTALTDRHIRRAGLDRLDDRRSCLVSTVVADGDVGPVPVELPMIRPGGESIAAATTQRGQPL
jgi:hypothetical protein